MLTPEERTKLVQNWFFRNCPIPDDNKVTVTEESTAGPGNIYQINFPEPTSANAIIARLKNLAGKNLITINYQANDQKQFTIFVPKKQLDKICKHRPKPQNSTVTEEPKSKSKKCRHRKPVTIAAPSEKEDKKEQHLLSPKEIAAIQKTLNALIKTLSSEYTGFMFLLLFLIGHASRKAAKIRALQEVKKAVTPTTTKTTLSRKIEDVKKGSLVTAGFFSESRTAKTLQQVKKCCQLPPKRAKVTTPNPDTGGDSTDRITLINELTAH